MIKHPFIEKFSDNSLEYIDKDASSASQIVLELILATPLLMDNQIAEQIFWGIISDTNRFMFNNSKSIQILDEKLNLILEKIGKLDDHISEHKSNPTTDGI